MLVPFDSDELWPDIQFYPDCHPYGEKDLDPELVKRYTQARNAFMEVHEEILEAGNYDY